MCEDCFYHETVLLSRKIADFKAVDRFSFYNLQDGFLRFIHPVSAPVLGFDDTILTSVYFDVALKPGIHIYRLDFVLQILHERQRIFPLSIALDCFLHALLSRLIDRLGCCSPIDWAILNCNFNLLLCNFDFFLRHAISLNFNFCFLYRLHFGLNFGLNSGLNSGLNFCLF